MSVFLCPSAKQQYFDANGEPLAGGKLYTYYSGTTNPQATYTDWTGTTANANPVVLDSRGEANVYWLNNLYTVMLRDADNSLVYTQDGVAPAFSQGNLIYKGTWDADTNDPELVSSIGITGDYYVVDVTGETELDGIASWEVGDWVVFGAIAWEKIPLSISGTINGGTYA